MRGHAILARVLLVYEAGLRRDGPGRGHRPGACSTRRREISRGFIHDHQEKMEEELVFTRFKTAGRMVELVGVLANQHAAGRKLTEQHPRRRPAGAQHANRARRWAATSRR